MQLVPSVHGGAPSLLEAITYLLQHLLWTACQNSDTRWLGKAVPRGTGQTGKLTWGAETGLWMLTHGTATVPFAGGQEATSTPGLHSSP